MNSRKKLSCFDTRHLFVRKNKKGRGVYTDINIKKGEVLLDNPVVFFQDSTISGILQDYTFQWDEEKSLSALALGILSMVNHSYSPNCKYEFHHSKKTISLHSIRPIKKGEEITMNYNQDPEDTSPVEFEVLK